MGELPLVQEDESHRVSAVCVVRRSRQTPGTCMMIRMQIVPGCCKKIGIGPKWHRLIFIWWCPGEMFLQNLMFIYSAAFEHLSFSLPLCDAIHCWILEIYLSNIVIRVSVLLLNIRVILFITVNLKIKCFL